MLREPPTTRSSSTLSRENDRCVSKRGCPRRWSACAAALPSVHADVVVIAAGAHERGLRSELCHQRKAEAVAVEGDGFQRSLPP